MDKTIIDAAVKELEWNQASNLPFDGEYYNGLISNYREFATHLVGDAGARIYTTLLPLLTEPEADHSEFLGHHMRHGDQRDGKEKFRLYELTTEFTARGTPRFALEINREAFRKGYAATLDILEDDGDGHYATIAHISVFDEGEQLRGLATCNADGFPAISDFTRSFIAAAPHFRDSYLGMSDEGLLNDEFAALRDADGGVLGDHTMEAFDVFFTRAATHVCDWAAPVVDNTYQAQVDRGFVWGEKYLNFNDLDDSSCAIITDKPGRSAVMHENTSLFSDFRRFVAWVDRDPSGSSPTLSVRMLRYDESLSEAVAALRNDELASTLEYDLVTRTVTKAANFHETRLIEMFHFYLNEDHKLFALGNMDADGADDCHVETDFSELDRDPDGEFDEDFDDDDAETGLRI